MEANNEEVKSTETPKVPRQILIETDGNSLKIVKAEVAGAFELKAILQSIIDNLK